MSAALALIFTACGSTANTNSSASNTTVSITEMTTTEITAEETTDALTENAVEATSAAAAENNEIDETDERESDGSNVLVVYYSASGNTERVVNDIANAAGADIFEIVPTEVYTGDDLNWTNSDSRVSREHDDESFRDVPITTTTVEKWTNLKKHFVIL